MALKNTAWHSVEPGQIVTFIYKSEGESRGYKRTVLIINPDMRYRKKTTGRIKRFVVGIQLDTQITRPITETKLEMLFKRVGGPRVCKNLSNTIDVNKAATPRCRCVNVEEQSFSSVDRCNR